jgi:hypothetical protein
VTGSSLVQRSPTECAVSECDREASEMRRPWPTRDCQAMETKMKSFSPLWQCRFSRYAAEDVCICLLICDRPDFTGSGVKSLLPQDKDHQQTLVNMVTNFFFNKMRDFLV